MLVLGAHCDDIEIGCGGTLLEWTANQPELEVEWVTFSAPGERRAETERAAADFLARAKSSRVLFHDFRDSYFPAQWAELKAAIQKLAAESSPDVVLTHRRGDRHQDHDLVGELTWNAFRDHVVLEYEIPKWEGDLGQPNAYVALSESSARRKIELLMSHYASQRSRDWFSEDLFAGLMRVRGVECRAPSGFAEGFHAAKLRIGAPGSG